MTYSESYMQKRLSGFFSHSTVKYDIDGLYVFAWESDKLIETRSGLIYEFEIKISRSDFKNDFKHKVDKHIILGSNMSRRMPSFNRYYENNKKRFVSIEACEIYCRAHYKFYFTDHYKKPNYFYYAVPEGLVSVEEVPEYAGLVYVTERSIDIIKKAPILHKEKYTDQQLGLGEKFYYNMVSWRQRCHREHEEATRFRLKLQAEIKAKGQEGAYYDLKKQLEAANELYSETNRNLSELEKTRRVELGENRRLIRAMSNEIRKYDPSFNYEEFEEQILKV